MESGAKLGRMRVPELASFLSLTFGNSDETSPRIHKPDLILTYWTQLYSYMAPKRALLC